jgi:hypothetical protein
VNHFQKLIGQPQWSIEISRVNPFGDIIAIELPWDTLRWAYLTDISYLWIFEVAFKEEDRD